MKSNLKLRNIIFPVWFLWVLPPVWLVIIPINIIIDAVVLYLSMKYMEIIDIKEKVKKIIVKTVLFGFLSDIIGSLLLLISVLLIDVDYKTDFGKWWIDNVRPAATNPFDSVISFLIVVLAIGIAGILIYYLNKKFAFKNLDIEEYEKHILARNMAIFTAPYLYLIPAVWFK
ncbi:MAG: hypothetical protein Q4E02_01820 [Lagierella massiliensis]|nr:hypothetical protein [Lagierella massiliensis]